MPKIDPVVIMASLRLFSGLLELGAALLILRLARVEAALRINGVLALVGPTILLAGILVGIAGLSDRLPISRLLLVYLGALLIFLGTRR